MKNHQHLISQWLEQIGKKHNITLRLEANGHCVVPCIDGMHGVIEVPADLEVPAVFIYLPLVQLSDDPGQWLLIRAALEMNLFGLLTGGSQIALDTRSNTVVLSYSVIIDAIDCVFFQRVLSEMLEIAPHLRQRLQDVAIPSWVKSDQPLVNQRRFGQ